MRHCDMRHCDMKHCDMKHCDMKHCELPGCSAPIEDIPGRPARRYCSPAHRAAARRSRRAVTAVEQAARLAEALPWLGGGSLPAERTTAPRVSPVVTTVVPVDAVRPDDPVPQVVIESSPARAGAEGGDRGATVHRAMPPGRRTWPGESAQVRASHAHRAVEPALGAARSASSARLRGRPATSVVGSPGRDESAGRLRGLAVLGAAAVLIGSYAVTTSDTGTPGVVVPTQIAPVGETQAQWAVRAQGVLASVTEQLEIIADTEVTWNRAGEAQRSAARAAPFEALKQRKQLLLQRQTSLRSQLAAYQSLLEAKRQLVLAEQQLAVIEVALRDAPPVGERTPEQTYAIAMLVAQRDLQLAQRDARRQEVLRLEQAVVDAVRTPLPADDRHTAVVSGLVLDSLAGADEPAPGDTPRARRPDGIDNRAGNLVTRVRYDIPNGAPPDPRGPRAQPQRGPVGEVTHTVRDTVQDAVPAPVLPGPSAPREQPRTSFGGGMADAIAGPLVENIPGAKDSFAGGGGWSSGFRGVDPRSEDSDGTSQPRQDADADVDMPDVPNLPGQGDEQTHVATAPSHGDETSVRGSAEESDDADDRARDEQSSGSEASDDPGSNENSRAGSEGDSDSASGDSQDGDSDGADSDDGDSDDGDSDDGDSDGGESGDGESGGGDSDGGESGGGSDGGDSGSGDSGADG